MAKQSSTTDGLSDVSNMLSTDFLKTKDVEKGLLTFGIARVDKVTFDAKGDKPAEQKLVLTFEGDPPRKLSLNQTNLQTLFDAWGKDATRWAGLVLDCYFDKMVRDPSGKQAGGLRVRPRQAAIVAQIGAGANGSDVTEAVSNSEIPF